ncbi:MAG: glycosyltransferase [Sphingobacteriales bacterium]|nr:MAG: glycosyltransferase [Sphingobacteriales bacterium]
MTKLAIITTHPIQYYAPVFRLLAKQLDIKVFYTWGKQVLENKYDPGFKREIEWDIPLLNGYNYHFTQNDAKDAGSHHSKGIINPNIINEIKAFEADAILVYGHSYHSHLRVMRYFKGKIPIYFRGDSTLLDENSFVIKTLKTIYLRWVYSFVDYAFYVGNANKAYFKQYGIKENRLLFAPHAVDNDRFGADRSKEAAAIRNNLGIPEKGILVLFTGKFETKKNPEILLNTFIGLRKENVYLLFVGNGELEKALKETAKRSKKRHFIFFEDFKNQEILPAYYQACDLFCLPSKGPGETWGLAVNEAMAASKAILISNKVGCAANLIVEGANGYVFEVGNSKRIAENLRLLLFEKENLVKMGQASKNMINNYTFKIQAQNIINALK